MILELDLGNSTGKWRVVQQQNTVARGRFNYHDLPSFFTQLPSGLNRVRAVSVLGDERQNIITEALKKYLGVPVEFAIVVAEYGGVVNGYEDFSRLGADRWLAIVAAWKRLGCACVVVDAGSAITIDCLDNIGKHLGGYIIPGMSLMREILVAGTEKIRVETKEASLLPGVNTAQAVGHGGLLAAVAAVKVAADLLHHQLGVSPAILLTGGDAPLLLSELGEGVIHMPDLVFDGLGLVLP